MNCRRVQIIKEIVYGEPHRRGDVPIVRVAGLAVIANPFTGNRFVEDLSALFDAARAVGSEIMPQLVELLRRPAVSYGKAAIVGLAGEMEHGGACIHPKLGRPMRDAVGGGKAVIPSNCKVAAPGTPIDVPLGHKDEPFSFPHFDTMTVMLADAPRPDEIVVVMAIADGGRPIPRVGDRPLPE